LIPVRESLKGVNKKAVFLLFFGCGGVCFSKLNTETPSIFFSKIQKPPNLWQNKNLIWVTRFVCRAIP
jgi:hypothetical protein